nr:MAG TPA: hypothetical protein [Caudoviricetes sp.]
MLWCTSAPPAALPDSAEKNKTAPGLLTDAVLFCKKKGDFCALKTKERIDKRLLPCAPAYIIAHRFHIPNENCAAAPEETAANCKAPPPSGAPAPRSPLPKCPSCFLLFRRKGCPSPRILAFCAFYTLLFVQCAA